MNLKNKVAIVTGAASGIGRATSLRLAREGANIVAADINLEGAEKVVDELKALGSKAIAVKVDVGNSKEAGNMVKSALKEFDHIDILVNNAGGSARQRERPFYESTEDVWDYVITINLRGVLNCSRAIIEHMMQRRSGKIVNIGSVAGIQGDPGMAAYSSAKAGVIVFTKTLAKEVGPYGINVNCVSPGPIQTKAAIALPELFEEIKKTIHLGHRLGKPEEIANMVTFLASDEADYITGQNVAVDGGRSLGF